MRDEILTPFVAARKADLELYDLWGFALAPDGAGVGRTVATPTTLDAGLSTAPGPPAQPSPAERATRWSAWQTLVHEYIHTLAHPAWDGATSAGGGVMNEGFCEMFTAEILDAQIATVRQRRRRCAPRSRATPTTPPPGPAILPTTYASPVDLPGRPRARRDDPHAARRERRPRGVLPGPHRVPRARARRRARRAAPPRRDHVRRAARRDDARRSSPPRAA